MASPLTTYQRGMLARRRAVGVMPIKVAGGWFGAVFNEDGEQVPLPHALTTHETKDAAIDAIREWAMREFPHNDVIVCD